MIARISSNQSQEFLACGTDSGFEIFKLD